jgi:hypothetical protein
MDPNSRGWCRSAMCRGRARRHRTRPIHRPASASLRPIARSPARARAEQGGYELWPATRSHGVNLRAGSSGASSAPDPPPATGQKGFDAQARRHRPRRRPRHPHEEPGAEDAPPARGASAHLLRRARGARCRRVGRRRRRGARRGPSADVPSRHLRWRRADRRAARATGHGPRRADGHASAR